MINRIPPQNLEAEMAVLGSILIDNNSLNKIIGLLHSDFFYDPRHNIIYELIVELFSQSRPIDVLTLTSELKKQKKFKQIGGATYLSEVISSVPTAANIEEYARLVRESAIRRNLIKYSVELDEYSRKEDKPIEDIMDELETKLLALSKDTAARDFFDSSTLLEMHMERADLYAKNPEALRGISTGLRDLDGILGGLHKSDLIIMAARPSVGKSALGFDILRHIAVKEKKTIAIFSLEMPALQVIERMLAQQTRIDLWNLRMGKFRDSDYKSYGVGAAELADSKIYIDDTPGISIMQLRSKARKLMMDHSLDVVLIDYLQLMQGSGQGSRDSRAVEVGEISRSLKILARELDIPIIALSQLNRAVENRPDGMPLLSDLRESGSIEQDADLVIFLSREQSDAENTETKIIDLSVAKHRNGPIGRIKLEFVGAHQKFLDMKKE
jgi:replicative DNA helicase